MCGICGELRFDGRPADLAAIGYMTERLRPRGPDHGGSYSDGELGFGHRRLSIIDLSEKSNQPLVDQELGLALVFNGTIYNYRELRRDLRQRGYHFFSDGDSEVILKAYREWGEDCPRHLHGMFAFAVWDMREKSLFLARDRFGIKPCYWSRDAQRFRFASSLPALLAGGGVDVSLDAAALHFQFTLHGVVPAPRTILNGARKLEPATWLKLHADGREQQGRYWSLDATRPEKALSEEEWVEATHERLRAAVARRNDIADVPVGVLLSGGLDSSLLVALLAELGKSDLHTYSIGFEDQPEESGNEFEYSDQVVERYRPRHHKMLVPNDQVLARLPEAVDAMAEPMFGQDAVAFYLLSEQVSRGIKVVQSGQGADEVFGGYFWFRKIMEDDRGDCADRLRRYYFDRDHEEYLNMVQDRFRVDDVTGDYIRERLNAAGADECIDAVLRLDATTLIVDDPVKRVDNMTMAWGLEARV
ncbi:N-acetylglutaminylglutamine amidotransferase, partial [Thiolapillus sp.]